VSSNVLAQDDGAEHAHAADRLQLAKTALFIEVLVIITLVLPIEGDG